MSGLKPDNLNYNVYPMYNGRYRNRRMPVSNLANATVALAAGSTTMLEWKVPANTVFNLGRSTLDYNITVPAQGAATFIWNFEDTAEIVSSIQFCNASGVYLTDLQYASNYVAAARKIDMDKSDFESADFTGGLYKSTSPAANYFPPGAMMPYSVAAGAATNVYGKSAGLKVAAQTAFEPQYARVSQATDAVHTFARSLPLSAFTHTAVGMDRDLIFPEDMYIRINVSPSSKVAFTSTSNVNPTSAALALTVQPTISVITLQLAMQVDPLVEASLRAKFLDGQLSFLIPFQYGWRNSTASGEASIQLQLNNGYGNRLKRLLHVPFDSTEATNFAYDHQNLNGSKITQYQTMLDGAPLQDAKLSCLQPVVGGSINMDDWRENRPLLRGSAIENSLAYYFNWAHIDSFSQPKRGHIDVPDENILEGLDLSMPRQWTFTATTAVPLTHYTFGEFTRQVVSTPLGLQVVVV